MRFTNPAAANAAHQKMLALDGKLHTAVAHAVMPNHMHAVLRLKEFGLAETLKRLKGGISFDVNRAVGRSGSLWQEGYFDTLVEKHLLNCVGYTMDNPQNAGLKDWAWTHFAAAGWRAVLGL